MITLKINPTKKEDLMIKKRLEELFLARKIIEDDQLPEPMITQGPKEYKGIDHIEGFFGELLTLYDGWYEDRCDKYENEDGSPTFS